MPIKEKFKQKEDYNLRKKSKKTKIENKIDELKVESFHNRNIVKDLENDEKEWEIECKNRQKHTTKAKNNLKKENIRNIDDEFVKKAFSVLSNAKINIYQKIYKLCTTKTEEWDNISFASNKKKRERLIEMIEQEIAMINSKKFNFEKYENIIRLILSMDNNKNFPEMIMKNMYIAKLQNICFLLKEFDNDGTNIIEEVETAQNIYR